MKGRFAACLAVMLTGPARADELQAVDRFLDFLTNGCLQSVATGAAVGAFAKQAQAHPAPPDVAASVLGKDTGTVFLKDDPQHPVALAERTGGLCSVNAKFPTTKIEGAIDAIHDFIAGPGSRFTAVRVFEEAAGATWVTHRVYVGRRGGKDLTLLFSTHPEAPSFDQVMVTVAATPR